MTGTDFADRLAAGKERIDKEKILLLFKRTENLPDCEINGRHFSGTGKKLGECLHAIINDATPMRLEMDKTHVKRGITPAMANDILEEVGYLQLRMNNIYHGADKDAPAKEEAAWALLQCRQIYNTESSYGRYVQAVLDRTAEVLELGKLSKITVVPRSEGKGL